MTSPRLVRIEWDKAQSLDEALSSNLTTTEDYGLYQVYGNHVVFGPSSLLYVGRNTEQTFKNRLDQHRYWLKHEQDVSIRVGRIRKGDFEHDAAEWKDWTELVKDVEALTIFWHSPPYNSSGITRYKGGKLHVQNWAHRGRLLPEYSSDWEGAQVVRPDDLEPNV